MHIVFSKRFKKRHGRLSLELQDKFRNRLSMLLKSNSRGILNVHFLHGKYAGYQSLNVTGDIRAIFRINRDEGYIFLLDIGTHSELY